MMRMFDVQGIEIEASPRTVFEFLQEPHHLPQWAQAFASVDDSRARLQTPTGAVEVGLAVSANAAGGTVDWQLTFPDGTVGVAQSRVTGTTRGTSIYSFVLHVPPVALEELEGALEEQRVILRHELEVLKRLLEPA